MLGGLLALRVEKGWFVFHVPDRVLSEVSTVASAVTTPHRRLFELRIAVYTACFRIYPLAPSFREQWVGRVGFTLHTSICTLLVKIHLQ